MFSCIKSKDRDKDKEKEEREIKMKIRNSLRSVRKRHRANRVVRRRGRLFVINKVNPRFKVRQG